MPRTSSSQDIHARVNALFAGGDAEALRLIMDHYVPTLREQLRLRRGKRFDDDDVENVIEDAMLYLWEHRDQFDPQKGSVRVLLFWKAKRLVIDRLRQTPSLERTGTEDVLSLEAGRSSPSASEALSANEMLLLANEILGNLSEFERESLLASLRGPDGYANIVGKRFGKTPNEVRQATWRARHKLREDMGARGYVVP